jgi:methionine-rich copper-binding protein CopC
VDRRQFLAAAASLAAVASASPASARFMSGAFIDLAVPGVGLTVSGPVREVTLYFDLGVAAARVQVMSSAGTAIPASGPFIEPSGREIVTVRLGRALTFGTYQVSWEVMSVAMRSTWGTFRFMVSGSKPCVGYVDRAILEIAPPPQPTRRLA